jgi:excisionase family DNA binding protein
MNAEQAALLSALSVASATNDSPDSAFMAAKMAVLAAENRVAVGPMPYDVMTCSQVGEYLQLPEETVRMEANAGRLPGRRIEGEWRFFRLALTEWLKALDCRVPKHPPAGVGKDYLDEDPEMLIASMYQERKKMPVGG